MGPMAVGNGVWIHLRLCVCVCVPRAVPLRLRPGPPLWALCVVIRWLDHNNSRESKLCPCEGMTEACVSGGADISWQ